MGPVSWSITSWITLVLKVRLAMHCCQRSPWGTHGGSASRGLKSTGGRCLRRLTCARKHI